MFGLHDSDTTKYRFVKVDMRGTVGYPIEAKVVRPRRFRLRELPELPSFHIDLSKYVPSLPEKEQCVSFLQHPITGHVLPMFLCLLGIGMINRYWFVSGSIVALIGVSGLAYQVFLIAKEGMKR